MCAGRLRRHGEGLHGREQTMANVLAVGTRGPEVVELQRSLNDRAPSALPPLIVDGVFGSKTLARVREFQQRAGLVVDGKVGPQTLSALRRPARPSGRAKRICGNSLA